MNNKNEKSHRLMGEELLIPAFAVIFTLYFLSTIWHSPWTAKVSAYLIATVLMSACGLFFLKTGLLVKRGEASLGFGKVFSKEDITGGRVGLALLTIGYCYFIEDFGFTLTTFLFLAASMLVLGKGKRPRLILVISALMALGVWVVFIWAFDTHFPMGWFDTTMKELL